MRKPTSSHSAMSTIHEEPTVVDTRTTDTGSPSSSDDRIVATEPVDDDNYNDVIGLDYVLPKTTATFSMAPVDSSTTTDDHNVSSKKNAPPLIQKPLNLLPSLKNAIAEQKTRATDVWDCVLRQGADPLYQTLPTSIPHADAMAIRDQLELGLVLPAFHAYTIPEHQRIFHPYVLVNTGLLPATDQTTDCPVRLSFERVEAGMSFSHNNSTTSSSSSMDGTVLLHTHMDQLRSSTIDTTSLDNNTTRTIVPYGTQDTDASFVPPTAPTLSSSASSKLSFETDYMTTFVDPVTSLARDGIYDPGYILDRWEYSPELTRDVVHLINTPAEMIGEDVEVTPLSTNFGLDDTKSPIARGEDDCGVNLITRRFSRGVVLDCFRNCTRPTRTLAITGNPGIGKSYSLLFALQQALLFDRVCVMLFLPKQSKAMICIRNQQKVYVWEGTTVHDRATSSLFTNPNVIVLLDPLDAVDGGATFDKGARRLIYAATTHMEHFQPDLTKITSRRRPPKWVIPERERYLSPFNEAELRVALPFMIDVNKSTFDEAMQRTYDVGMAPRYVLTEEAYTARKQQIEQYLQVLQSDEKEILKLLDWNGCIGQENSALDASDSTISTVPIGVTAADMDDDFLEVDGIVIGKIGAKERMAQESPPPSPDPSPPPSPPRQPVPKKFVKKGKSLAVDGTMIFSLHPTECFPRELNAEYRSSSLVGYHGDRGVYYNTLSMTISSPMIYDTFVKHLMKSKPSLMVPLWDKVGCGVKNGMHECIADMFGQYVQEQRKVVDSLEMSYEKKLQSFHKFRAFELLKGKENMNPLSEWTVPLLCNNKVVIIDAKQQYPLHHLKHVFKQRNYPKYAPTFCRIYEDNSLIQFAGPGRCVYQVVTGDEYNMTWDDMVKVLVHGGYLLNHQKPTKRHGTIRCAPNPPPFPLHWYWLVPSTSAVEKWEQRGPAFYATSLRANESTEQRGYRRTMNRNKEEVNACIKKNVIQHVVVLDTLTLGSC
jgi:hypothetical protein